MCWMCCVVLVVVSVAVIVSWCSRSGTGTGVGHAGCCEASVVVDGSSSLGRRRSPWPSPERSWFFCPRRVVAVVVGTADLMLTDS